MLNNDECCICYENNHNKIDLYCMINNKKINSGHFICSNCYGPYIKYSLKCPLCRGDINCISTFDKIKIYFTHNYIINFVYFILDIIGYGVGLFLLYHSVYSILSSIYDHLFVNKLIKL
jgi:hypothetical protein